MPQLPFVVCLYVRAATARIASAGGCHRCLPPLPLMLTIIYTLQLQVEPVQGRLRVLTQFVLEPKWLRPEPPQKNKSQLKVYVYKHMYAAFVIFCEW